MSTDVGGVAAEQLQSLIMRIERLEEDKANIAADIREVFSEAKGQGFDVKIMRQVIRLRKMEESDYREQEEILDLYKRALGMQV
jgi:uncharacterized protein (UPF0335 family)